MQKMRSAIQRRSFFALKEKLSTQAMIEYLLFEGEKTHVDQ